MILGFLSDAHGNLQAYLEALRLLREGGAEQVAFLGDAVGYFAGTGVIDALMEPDGPEYAIMGNHDFMLLRGDVPENRERVYRLERVRSALTARQRRFLESLPRRLELRLDGRHVLLVHGAPDNELNGYLYPDTPLMPLEGGPEIVFIGQTHRPFIRTAGKTSYVNVGSCGLPRDHGGLGAAGLYDTKSGETAILRFPIEEQTRAALQSGPVADEVMQVLARRAEVPRNIHANI